jgi:hypothetical protein
VKRSKRLTRRQRGTHAAAVPYTTRPGTLNRHWRRAIESIVRTAAKPEHAEIALARKLGDEVVMRPFAREILNQRTYAIESEAKKRQSLYERVLEKFGENASRILGIDPAAASEVSRG